MVPPATTHCCCGCGRCPPAACCDCSRLLAGQLGWIWVQPQLCHFSYLQGRSGRQENTWTKMISKLEATFCVRCWVLLDASTGCSAGIACCFLD